MTVEVAAFYADVPGKPSRLDEYLAYALASKEALARTTPKSRYVLMTDAATAPKLAPHIEVRALMTGGRPLVLEGMYAQLAFVERSTADLIILPDVDCLANRDLTSAIPANVGFAMTHKGRKFHYRINNCGYVRDRDLAVWFLRRAIAILEGWPADQWDWLGDQEAWGAVAGLPLVDCDVLPEGIEQFPARRVGPWKDKPDSEMILVAHPEGRTIHVYPCTTHNCPMANDGLIRPAQIDCYMIHFKGDRKDFLDRFMAKRFGA